MRLSRQRRRRGLGGRTVVGREWNAKDTRVQLSSAQHERNRQRQDRDDAAK